MWRKLARTVTALAVVLTAGATLAAPVTADLARRAVGNWLKTDPALGCRLGSAPDAVKTCRAANGAEFHVVRLEGGGFAVTSGDTEIEPIIAFSSSGDLEENPDNPLWAVLFRDLARRSVLRQPRAAAAEEDGAVAVDPATKWAALLTEQAGADPTKQAAGRSSVSDLRVAPLLKTKWSQEDAANSGNGAPCYNYYTPSHYPCGCVATAGAQIMRYHKYPTASVSAGTYACKVSGAAKNLKMKGGTYDWSSMPVNPKSGVTTAQRQAIGKLTYDVGVSCSMSYRSSSSSAGGYMLAYSLPHRFGYANALPVVCSSGVNVPAADLKRALISNLSAKLPVAAELEGSGGHEVVMDGFGYSSGTFYVHINFGWSGLDDAWYAPPSCGDYSIVSGLVCNIYPKGGANKTIVSGRVKNSSGKVVKGATVKAVRNGTTYKATTDSRGIYALKLSAGTYKISASYSGKSSSATTVKVAACVGTKIYPSSQTFEYPPKFTVSNKTGVDFKVSTGGSTSKTPKTLKATKKYKAYVKVNWSSVSKAKSYKLYRGTSSKWSKAKCIKTLGSSTRSYKDKKAKLGYKYYYWVVTKVGSKTYRRKSSVTGYRKVELTVELKLSSDKKKGYVKVLVNGKWPGSSTSLKKLTKVSLSSSLKSLKVFKSQWKKPYVGYFHSPGKLKSGVDYSYKVSFGKSHKVTKKKLISAG